MSVLGVWIDHMEGQGPQARPFSIRDGWPIHENWCAYVCNIHKMTRVFGNSLALEQIMAGHVGHICNPMINPNPSHTLPSFTDLGLVMKKHVRRHLI